MKRKREDSKDSKVSRRRTVFDQLEYADNKQNKFKKVLTIWKGWTNARNPITTINSGSIQSLQLSPNEEFNYIPPQCTKEIYYSIFIHYLLRLGQQYDGNIYIVLEALLTIPFIPSPSGWKKGIDMADESDLVQNFILCFIDEKRDNHGAVSSGTHTRRQVCHQKKVHITKIMASLHKLPSLIELANTNNDTTTVVKKFVKELYLVRDLGATELIHVLTKIGIITNNVHISNTSICKGPETYNRLESLGVKTDDDREQLMTYLSNKYNIARDVVENGLCEALRWHNSSRDFWDTISQGQYIYTHDVSNNLVAYDVGGREVDVTIPRWDYTFPAVQPGIIRWWEHDYAVKYRHLMDRDILLTNN